MAISEYITVDEAKNFGEKDSQTTAQLLPAGILVDRSLLPVTGSIAFLRLSWHLFLLMEPEKSPLNWHYFN